MADIFSPRRQALIWRDLWIALAEAERDLGVDIPEDAIAAMRRARDTIDLDRVAEIEKAVRHDVMAHVRHYAEVAPAASAFIHLGATSAFVADNAGLVQIREALDLVRARLVASIGSLADFAKRYRDLPTLGYTHWQPAQPTTVGKRASLWLQDLVIDYDQVTALIASLRFRGARGTTGTEASFVELFQGNGVAVDELNERLAERFAFPSVYDVVGQTYPRKEDHRILGTLAGIGTSVGRFGQDIRLLQSYGEIEEPFGSSQIGSSAMPYKRNPMRTERACSLARHLCTLELDAAWTASVQGFERTLDDSANRRIAIPEAFLTTDSILQIVHNVSSGLVVHEAIIERRLGRALPFLVVEQILIDGVRAGGDRQDLHERIRTHAMQARDRLDAGSETNEFFDLVAADPNIGLDRERLDILAEPVELVGRAPEQVDGFLTRRVDPILAAHGDQSAPAAELRV